MPGARHPSFIEAYHRFAERWRWPLSSGSCQQPLSLGASLPRAKACTAWAVQFEPYTMQASMVGPPGLLRAVAECTSALGPAPAGQALRCASTHQTVAACLSCITLLGRLRGQSTGYPLEHVGGWQLAVAHLLHCTSRLFGSCRNSVVCYIIR